MAYFAVPETRVTIGKIGGRKRVVLRWGDKYIGGTCFFSQQTGQTMNETRNQTVPPKKLTLRDLIDVEQFQLLQDRLSEIHAFTTAILDNDGTILTASAWQDVCTKFHRPNAECAKACMQSDKYIQSHLAEANSSVSYECLNGLIDNATPIIIDGVHYGNFFTGQFFLKEPDLNFFRAQAKKYGFDEEAYLEAVRKVPIWTEEKLQSYIFFIKGLIEVITGMGSKNLKELESRQQLLENNERYRTMIQTAMDGFWVVDEGGAILEVNEAYCRMSGYSEEELLTMCAEDVEAVESIDRIASHFKTIAQHGEERFETRHRRKDGSLYDVEVNAQYRPFKNGRFFIFLQDITERKRSEEALKLSEETYRMLFDCINDAVFISEVTGEGGPGRFIAVNDIACERLGYTREELLSKTPTDINSDKTKHGVRALLTRIIQSGHAIVETEHCTKHGRVIPVEVSTNVRLFRNKTILHSIARDITERKIAEEKIHEKDIQFRKLSLHLPDLIFQFTRRADGSFYVPIASEGIVNIFGCSPEDVVNDFTAIARVIHPDDAERVLRDIEYSAEHLTFFTCEFRVIIPGRPVQWILSRSTPERLADGSVTWYGFNANITERKQDEAAIAEEKERLSVTLRSIGDGVITTDVNGNITMLNKAAEAMTGWKAADAAGRPFPEIFVIVNEITRKQCENPVKKVLTTGAIVELANHTCLLTKDGREIIIADSGAPIRDKESAITGVVIVFRDMTEKQRLSDSMQREQKLESLGILAGGIAHDFNNMLAGIFGYLDIAKDSIAVNNIELLPKYLDKALGVYERAKGLTQQLLTFAKGGAPVRRTMPLAPLIQHSVTFALSGSNVRSRIDIAHDLWLCDCDETQIGQAIDNIIINGIQAMPMGGTIGVTAVNVMNNAAHPGNFVGISIQDGGSGIPPEILPKIFDPFFTTKTTGHGLGLATVYSIIQRHDGWIDVESKQGLGTTFHLFLPASSKQSVSDGGREAVSHTGTGTIMVMDDEEFIREIVASMLQHMGYTVALAKDGQEALALFIEAERSNRPFVASILDMTIPGGIGGKEVALKIRRMNQNAIIIASSGYTEDPVIANPTDHGFTDRIIKPYRRNDLAELMVRLVPRNK